MIQGVHRRTKRQVKNPHAGPSAIRLRGLLSFLFPILSHSVPCGKTGDNALILLGVDLECSWSWLGDEADCERNGVERAPMRSLDFLCAFLDFFGCPRINLIQGVHRRTKRQVKNPHAGPSAIRRRGLFFTAKQHRPRYGITRGRCCYFYLIKKMRTASVTAFSQKMLSF